ncbi:hypothetical protein O978_23660 [Mycobacterium avium subsp. paratuberculosis 10-5864]|nr:hypothetical protein O978_23660 [Mycobacterium avium subsp. paratuberculosis 10-5864]
MTAIRCDDVVTATRVPAARQARPPRPAPAECLDWLRTRSMGEIFSPREFWG